MIDTLRLKGDKHSNGETVGFTIAEVSFINQRCGDWWIEQDGCVHVIDPATIQLADDPRNGISERTILDIVQSMAEESLSPDNFEGLIFALEELKRNRSIDSNYVSEDPRKAMLDEIRTRIYQEFDSCEHHFVHQVFEVILDEMEAKL